jgi:putative transposase
MTDHLGYEKRSPEGRNSGNSRNYSLRKIIKNRSLFLNDEVVFKLL